MRARKSGDWRSPRAYVTVLRFRTTTVNQVNSSSGYRRGSAASTGQKKKPRPLVGKGGAEIECWRSPHVAPSVASPALASESLCQI